MEADWEVEMGGEAPAIDAHWAGFVDLRRAPERVSQLAEAADFPALAVALARLNAPPSPVWTSKCDVWHPEAIDPDEMDASIDTGNFALACYIDLLPLSDRNWGPLDSAVDWCQRVCSQVRARPNPCCRADLIIRRACLWPQTNPDRLGVGVTAYLTACGRTGADAIATLSCALGALVDAILGVEYPAPPASKLQ